MDLQDQNPAAETGTETDNEKNPWHLQPGIITLIASVIVLGIFCIALLAFLGF